MSFIKLKILLISSLLLTACSSATTPSIAVSEDLIIISPEKPRPINTRPVEFIVVTDNNRTKLDSQPVWYAITTDSYENLAYNMQEMIRYISQQQIQVNYYKSITPN
jgi:outer membrane biogenesis lipoprotein LolB